MKFGEGESNYIKGSDLQGKEVVVTISGIREETVGKGADAEDKFILFFAGKSKGMVMNVTNQKRLIALHGEPAGDPSAHFTGKQVCLYFDPMIEFGGNVVGGLRLKGVDQRQTPQAAADLAPPTPDPAAGQNPAHAPEGDDIPF